MTMREIPFKAYQAAINGTTFAHLKRNWPNERLLMGSYVSHALC